jgi:hypothetical protein
MHAILHHGSCFLTSHLARADFESAPWHAAEPQPLRPILITLALISLLLLTWVLVGVA